MNVIKIKELTFELCMNALTALTLIDQSVNNISQETLDMQNLAPSIELSMYTKDVFRLKILL
jgi:hypothetical protein